MKKTLKDLIILIFVFFNVIYADIQPQCGIFTNVLQTRDKDSEIDASSGHSEIYYAPSCTLQTPDIDHGKGDDGLYCNDTLASASGKVAGSLNVVYDFNTQTTDIDDVSSSPSNSNNNVNIYYEWWPSNGCKNTVLPNSEYNKITQDDSNCNFSLTYDGDKKINKFDQVFHTITFDNLENHSLKIGKFVTKSNSSTDLVMNGISTLIEIDKVDVFNTFTFHTQAKNYIHIDEMSLNGSSSDVSLKAPDLKIKKLSVDNGDATINLEADNEIDMEELDPKGTSSDITIKTPKLIINSIEFGNPSWGKKQVLKIYADEIDIKNIDFGENTEVYIYPYTPGKNIVFHSDNLATSSTSKFFISSGDYYVAEAMKIHDSSNGQVVAAMDNEQIINFYTKGLDLGSNSALNADGVGGDFGDNNPANFRLFIDGDLKTGGGSSNSADTINALVYVEDDVELGSATYVRGAISSNGDIKIGDGSKFYWDDRIGDSDIGPCRTISYQNNFSCGIFPTALTSYDEILTQQNGIYNTCVISVKDYNLQEDSKHPVTCYDTNGALCSCDPTTQHCSSNNTCEIIQEPKNKLNYDVYVSALANESYTVDKNWNNDDNGATTYTSGQGGNDINITFTNLEYANYTFTKDVSYINFEPENTYEDKDVKVMLLGDFTFAGNGQTITFDGGDYYFKSFKIDKTHGNVNQINICAKDNIRIFIDGDFVYSGNHLNDVGCGGKIFVYVNGNAEIDANGGGHSSLPFFIYVKGDVTIENNGNSNNWIGAITAEGKINITGQNINFTYDDSASDFGYGKCQLCYALNNNGSWIGFGKFMNMQFNFPRTIGIVNDSDENLSNVVVSQVEDMSGFSGTGACFDVVDQDGNSANKDITIDYSGFGWVSDKCVMGGLGDTNVTADIGDYENGGYDKYLAIETTGISGQFMGSDELSYYAHYTDKSGREYNVQLDYCNIPSIYTSTQITGKFDAWDTDHNINDRNITTKIVNKEFNLTLVSLDDNDNLSKKQNINVKYSLIDMAHSKILIPWRDFNASQNEEINASFNVNKAVKDVRVVFNVCSDYNGTDYTLYPYERCSEQCTPNDKQTNGNPCWRYFYSSDNFAIRPYGFRVFGINQYKRAAEEFNLTIKAVDENNYTLASGSVDDVRGIDDYNETLGNLNFNSVFYMPSSSDIRQMNKDVYNIDDDNASRVAKCPYAGVFTTVNNTDSFKNGEINATLKFTETGILEVNVSEKAGKEFALVDADDTPDSQRFIKPSVKIYDIDNIANNNYLLFIPYKFVTVADYNTTTASNWVYMSMDVNKSNTTFTTPRMAAYIEYNITAYNKDGAVTKNFTKTCFPDVSEANCPRQNGLKLNTTFDLFLDANLKSTKDVNMSAYVANASDDNAIWTPNKLINVTKTPLAIREWVSSTDFKNGSTKVRIYMNINKNYTSPMEEVNITAIDANTSTSWMTNPGATKIFIGSNLNKSITYKYGRIKVSNVSGYSNELNTTFEYQYWSKTGWTVNEKHNNDKIFGDINLSKSIYPSDVTISILPQSSKNILNGLEKVKFSTTHTLPYSAKIHLSIPEWLWYHPLAKNYKDPSSSNTDCLTHPCLKADFLKSGTGWGGIEAISNEQFNEENRTSDLNASKNDINVSKSQVKKINW